MPKPVRSTAARWLRRTIVLAGVLECAMLARGGAQATELPFDVGERLHYRVSLGRLGTVGEGEFSVDGPEAVRGTETLVLRSQVSARVGFVKTTERAQSWIDPTRMTALRYRKRTHGALTRDDEQQVELFPEAAPLGRPTWPLRREPDEHAARRAVLHLLPPHPAARRGHHEHRG